LLGREPNGGNLGPPPSSSKKGGKEERKSIPLVGPDNKLPGNVDAKKIEEKKKRR